jgi:hypothetical protein
VAVPIALFKPESRRIAVFIAYDNIDDANDNNKYRRKQHRSLISTSTQKTRIDTTENVGRCSKTPF